MGWQGVAVHRFKRPVGVTDEVKPPPCPAAVHDAQAAGAHRGHRGPQRERVRDRVQVAQGLSIAAPHTGACGSREPGRQAERSTRPDPLLLGVPTDHILSFTSCT